MGTDDRRGDQEPEDPRRPSGGESSDGSRRSYEPRSFLANANPGAEPAGAPLDQRDILGIPVTAAPADDAVAHLLARLGAREQVRLAFANSNMLMESRRVSLDLPRTNFLVLNDGLAMDFASTLLYGRRFPDNLNGTDFLPRLLTAAPPDTRVFLYGSRSMVVERAALLIGGRYGVNVCGVADGYRSDPVDVAARANAAAAQIVLVGLGNPRQEMWIAEHSAFLHAPLVIGAGAFFDFVAGAVRRAPPVVRKLRLEWAFRFLGEPRRLARRYTVEAMRFALLVLRQKYRPSED